jgi:Arc/MetJ family transcription regulator
MLPYETLFNVMLNIVTPPYTHYDVYREVCGMRTNIEIDEAMMRKAMELSGLKTKREVVEHALREFVERRMRKDLRDLRGAIQFADGYDYKAMRRDR